MNWNGDGSIKCNFVGAKDKFIIPRKSEDNRKHIPT